MVIQVPRLAYETLLSTTHLTDEKMAVYFPPWSDNRTLMLSTGESRIKETLFSLHSQKTTFQTGFTPWALTITRGLASPQEEKVFFYSSCERSSCWQAGLSSLPRTAVFQMLQSYSHRCISRNGRSLGLSWIVQSSFTRNKSQLLL